MSRQNNNNNNNQDEKSEIDINKNNSYNLENISFLNPQEKLNR